MSFGGRTQDLLVIQITNGIPDAYNDHTTPAVVRSGQKALAIKLNLHKKWFIFARNSGTYEFIENGEYDGTYD